MKKTTRNRIWAASILAGFLGACALPMSSTPTQFVFPTPNLTMTALFQIPPTATTGVEPTAKPTVASVSATPSVTLSPTALNCTNKAQFVSETVGDLTYLAPGTAFTKTWSLKNIGTCTWGAGYALVFDSGDQMGGPASVPLTASVPPNALYNFTVNLTAPSTGGQFQGYWKLQTPQGVKFGLEVSGMNSFWVKITTVPLAPACNAQSRRPDANGSLVEAYQTGGTAPSIDWTLVGGEWTIPLVNSVTTKVFGTTSETATFTLKWDSENLYMVVLVADGTYQQDTGGGPDMYKGDSIEILLDTNLKGDYCDTGMSSDDYQLGISAGSGASAPAAYLWYPLAKAGSKVITASAHITPSGWIATPVGWIMIAKIPWNIFGVTPAGGEYYGFAFSVSDDNHPGQNLQDGMISTDPKRAYPSNPTLWGTLEVEVKTGP
jgi:Ig-like domain from next to BRCA1 gene/Carbohydrate family 9 binding domain-like